MHSKYKKFNSKGYSQTILLLAYQICSKLCSRVASASSCMKAKSEGNCKKTIIMNSELKRGESCQSDNSNNNRKHKQQPHHTGHNPQGHYNWEKDNWFESKTAEFLSLSALSLLSACFDFLLLLFFCPFQWSHFLICLKLEKQPQLFDHGGRDKEWPPLFFWPPIHSVSPLLSIIQINGLNKIFNHTQKKKIKSCNLLLKIVNVCIDNLVGKDSHLLMSDTISYAAV